MHNYMNMHLIWMTSIIWLASVLDKCHVSLMIECACIDS